MTEKFISNGWMDVLYLPKSLWGLTQNNKMERKKNLTEIKIKKNK